MWGVDALDRIAQPFRETPGLLHDIVARLDIVVGLLRQRPVIVIVCVGTVLDRDAAQALGEQVRTALETGHAPQS